ncbi:MAG: alcohol dehydrogenase [Acidobacteria bacterium]|nr:MAG: alcohol dehydrogenase [Acidobacteriota bacterium]
MIRRLLLILLFLGAQRNGTYTGSNIAKSWPAEGPPIRWQRKIGAGFSGPVVAGAKLILFHRVDDKETIECIDADKGTPLWTSSYPTHYRDDFGFDEGPRATPAIADGRVYTYGAEGLLTCWNFADGKKLWTVDAKKEYGAPKGFFGIACSPLVEGDSVLLNIGGRNGSGIVAFDKATGKQRWKTTDQEASYSSPVAADVHGKRYAFFLTREGLVILSPASGEIAAEFPWRPPINASVSAATPLVIDDYIFLSTSYDRGAILLQFDSKNLKQIWSGDDQLSNHYATSVHHDGHLYGFHGRQEQGCDLRCVELKTGKVKWSQDQFGAGTVTLVNNELFVLSEKGELVRAPATPSGFKPSARAQILSFQVRAYPAIANGRLYARSKDRLVCADLR